MRSTIALSIFCLVTTIFSPAQVFTTLVNFDVANGGFPEAPLIQATDGNLYGTTILGGSNGRGTVFKMTPDGTLITLHSFDREDGAAPLAGLVQAADGNFYGTTNEGGTNNAGTIFKITPQGFLTTLYSFFLTDGAGPRAGLVQGSDGDFYGTTCGGGDYGLGNVFKVTPEGVLTTLHSFCPQGWGNCSDGFWPQAELVQAADGNFYGTTPGGGGPTNDGTIFRVTPNGIFTTLHAFHGDDGFAPYAGLVQATDGNLYGVTNGGGSHTFFGTVFRISLDGKLSTLYNFNSTDGSAPQGTMVQATDGNLYGTTSVGGTSDFCTVGCGTVFKITLAGTLTKLHDFDFNYGYLPSAGLLQAADGGFYGTTYAGGSYNYGTVFRLRAILPNNLAKPRESLH